MAKQNAASDRRDIEDIGTRSLDLLISSLSRLRDGSGNDESTEILWPTSVNANDHDFIASKTSLGAGMADLYHLKNAKATLAALIRSLEAKITALKDRLGPASLHYGITSVPDEILADILFEVFRVNHPCGCHTKTLVELSSVCRRFRDLIYNCPKFWARICTSCTIGGEGKLDKQLHFSKSAALHVKIERRCDDFLRLSLAHKQRWSNLNISMNLSALLDLVESHSNAIFPSTIRLYAFIDIEDMRPPRCCDRFFSTWSFPALRFMDICGVVPTSVHFAYLTEARLTSFPTTSTSLNETFVQNVILFLHHTPRLEALLVDVSFVFSAASLGGYGAVTLNHLTAFNLISSLVGELEGMNNPCPLSVIKEFVSTLRTPHLEKLALSIAVDESPVDLARIFFVLPPNQTYSSVKKLKVDLDAHEVKRLYASIDCEELFMRFPALTDLYIGVEVGEFSLTPLKVREQMKYLRNLYLVGFDVEEWEVYRLLDDLNAACLTLAELNIVPDRFFDKSGLDKKFPNTRITVLEPDSGFLWCWW